jgi:hypothetical protein
MARSKSAKAAAIAENEQRKTAARNRIALNLLQHRYNSTAALNQLKVDNSAMKARHQIEVANLTRRHQLEKASLQKRHEIERKSHGAKMSRQQQIHQGQGKKLQSMIGALQK